MSIDSTWLRCPNCVQPLIEVTARVLGCDSGHRFDVSKHGIVSLLPPRAPRTVGDTREMLDARARVLSTGIYRQTSEAIAEAVSSVEQSSSRTMRIADLGCGTGHYSADLAQRFPAAAFLLADRSPIAVRMASKAVPNATGVVLDLWRPLPVRDASADVSINVFAPRNPEEFARITRPGGSLVVVVPTDRHLDELRARGGMLDIPSGKAEHVTHQLTRAGWRPASVRRIDEVVPLDATQARWLVDMGPSAHHVTDDGGNGAPAKDADASEFSTPEAAPTEVSVSVEVLHFLRH